MERAARRVHVAPLPQVLHVLHLVPETDIKRVRIQAMDGNVNSLVSMIFQAQLQDVSSNVK